MKSNHSLLKVEMVVAAPVALPAVVVQIATYMAIAASVATAISQATMRESKGRLANELISRLADDIECKM